MHSFPKWDPLNIIRGHLQFFYFPSNPLPTVQLAATSNQLLSWFSVSLWFVSTLMRIWHKTRCCWHREWKLSSVIRVLPRSQGWLGFNWKCGWTPSNPIVQNTLRMTGSKARHSGQKILLFPILFLHFLLFWHRHLLHLFCQQTSAC